MSCILLLHAALSHQSSSKTTKQFVLPINHQLVDLILIFYIALATSARFIGSKVILVWVKFDLPFELGTVSFHLPPRLSASTTVTPFLDTNPPIIKLSLLATQRNTTNNTMAVTSSTKDRVQQKEADYKIGISNLPNQR